MNNFILDDKLKQLNENQLKAVKHINKPLFVVAGAGTGKTNTLTTKIAYLILKENVSPNNILALTFTNKAAQEIRERVNNMITPYQMGSWLYTFHSFCLRILRIEVDNLNNGYKENFNVADEDDSKTFIKTALENLHMDNKKYRLGDLKNVISNHKMLIETINDNELLDIYAEYQNELIRNNFMDFDDLIKNTYLLFKDNDDILKKYQDTFKYVLVDEFQDTDLIQYELLKLINSTNTFVVGDPDQSIYTFRGARYENNDLFLKDFNADIIVLNENYRSTNNILKLANKSIENNKSRTTKNELKSNLGDGEKVVIERLNNDLDEVDFIIRQIKMLKLKKVPYSEMVVLYRNNALSRNFEHKFLENDIPYIIYGGISFYQRREVKDLLAYIKLVLDSNNDFYFKRVVNMPKRGIGKVSIEKLESYAMMNNLSLFEAIDFINLSKRTLNSLNEFKDIIKSIHKQIKNLTNIKEIVELVFDKVNYEIELDKDNPDVKQSRMENINELKTVFSMANNKYVGSNYDKLKETLDELALFTDQEITYDINNSVRLSTIHQVKGLEFNTVFVSCLEDEIFPNHRVLLDYTKLDEERRLFYVALTRAKERLYLTSSYSRRLYGQFSYMKESKFIKEILDVKTSSNTKLKESKKGFTNKTKFNVGDTIIHTSFERGIIVSIEDDVLTIAFSHPHGVKKIKSTFDGIKKE